MSGTHYSKNIHWFPGHMKKALIELQEKVKLVDLIIEILDARAPFSSRNPYFTNIAQGKKRLIILNKNDIADLKDFDKNAAKLNDFDVVIESNLTNKNDYKSLFNEITKISDERKEKFLKKGMKPQLLRAMVIGIPNVGKSSFINYLNNKNSAAVGNTPGFTKANKWIKVDNLFYLLDTPGILPANYEDERIKINLALIGSIKQEILPIDLLANELIELIKEKYMEEFNNKYSTDFKKECSSAEIFEKIAIKRGFLLKAGVPDIEKAQTLLLNDFKNGKICKVRLD